MFIRALWNILGARVENVCVYPAMLMSADIV